MRVSPSVVATCLLFVSLISCLPAFYDDVSVGQTPLYSTPVYTPPVQASPDYSPPSSPAPQPPNTQPAVGIDNNKQTPPPSFSRQFERCARPGDIINFKGQHLSQLDGYELFIHANKNEIKLTRLHSSNKGIIVRIPEHSALKNKRTYKVILRNRTNKTQYFPAELSILICLLNSEQGTNNVDHEVGQILVLVDTQSVAAFKQAASSIQLKLIKEVLLKSFGETMLLLKTSEINLQNGIKSLRKKFPEATIDVNSHYRHAASSARIYAPQMISWSSCHNKSYEGLTIGIIDGQPDLSHPALLNQQITIKNFLTASQQADRQHGTAIAAIITGNQPEAGFEGILPKVKIMAAVVLRQEDKELLATTESIIRSINWLMLNNIRLINVSLSGSKANLILTKAFAIAVQKKLIIFAAAGNGGKTAPKSYPAALPGVIAITAIDAAARIYQQANQGEYIDFSAPGVDIWVTHKDSKGKYSS
ncbi:MAG: S8 family serine peptidase, partial [Immundisolibacteraceae bacterium]|nr:S8 family serine peptidase [Immundisolibacteraceae bacterium]